MNITEHKFCAYPTCKKVIQSGRSNKKYCSNRCRSAHYQIIHQQSILAERKLTKGNRDNERVLKELLERLPLSKQYKNYVDISKETLFGAGYNQKYTGMTALCNWDGITVNTFHYNDVILVSHPHQPSRYLICKRNDRNTQ